MSTARVRELPVHKHTWILQLIPGPRALPFAQAYLALTRSRAPGPGVLAPCPTHLKEEGCCSHSHFPGVIQRKRVCQSTMVPPNLSEQPPNLSSPLLTDEGEQEALNLNWRSMPTASTDTLQIRQVPILTAAPLGLKPLGKAGGSRTKTGLIW